MAFARHRPSARRPGRRNGNRARRAPAQGAALLLAMVILTLVATLAAGMVWQQWRSVQVEAAERARAQAAWILTGGLDWSRLILREDALTGRATSLTEPWATPLAETRLSTFLATDADNNADNTDSGPEVFISGSMRDAQSRYNLRNLIDATGKVNPAELKVLQRLCASANVASSIAGKIADGLQAATLASVGAKAAGTGADGAADAPLLPRTLAQLSWFGLDAETLSRLAPYVDLLPQPTPVNLNTAPREVLAAVIEGLDLGSAERLLQARQRKAYANLAEAKGDLPPGTVLDEARVGVLSRYFEIDGRLRLEDRVLQERSLVERRGNRGSEVVAIQRARVNLQTQPP
jgi:general secretion pathway protein K